MPYGVVTTSSMIESNNQYWIFPLWTYIHDFGNWLDLGVIIPPFLPSFSLLLPIVGLIWCVLGLYTAMILNQFYNGQRDAKSVWLPTIYLLVLQVIVTTVLGFVVWHVWLILVIPLPFHYLIILLLLRAHIKRLNDLTQPFV
ncbi:hypothetical protein EU527_17440 [Candidatus Thorarchaeota archaeon]|nr:MAG: hypothetical protein EU527_17440 [Candidatus Thorarchaeota archaeon]